MCQASGTTWGEESCEGRPRRDGGRVDSRVVGWWDMSKKFKLIDLMVSGLSVRYFFLHGFLQGFFFPVFLGWEIDG